MKIKLPLIHPLKRVRNHAKHGAIRFASFNFFSLPQIFMPNMSIYIVLANLNFISVMLVDRFVIIYDGEMLSELVNVNMFLFVGALQGGGAL